MIYAPVVIPTLCRSEHFIRCVESLKKNTWAKYTEVYIGLDYPAKEQHRDGYTKICDYLEKEDFSAFKAFSVIRREKNYGARNNVNDLYESIFETYDRVIYSEDDIEFSPDFLEYMDKTLYQYEDNQDVVLVSGYSYPIQWDVSEGSTLFKENVSAPMWGAGYWRDKREFIKNYMEEGCLIAEFPDCIRDRTYKHMIDRAFIDYVDGVTNPDPSDNLLMRISDVSLRIYFALKNKYAVIPTISKTRNFGFDGTGEYCQNIIEFDDSSLSTYNYPEQPIDECTEFELVEDIRNSYSENQRRLNRKDKCTYKKIVIARIKCALYIALGRKNCLACVKFLKNSVRIWSKNAEK